MVEELSRCARSLSSNFGSVWTWLSIQLVVEAAGNGSLFFIKLGGSIFAMLLRAEQGFKGDAVEC
jgi:hypothetical protein